MSVFRFAPSPNGYLHLGHALSALLNADMARESGGRLLLRIEDIDPDRSRPEFEAAVYEDLGWLGIAWEQPVRRQSEHLADYAAALGRLDAMGLLYPSFESRAKIARLVAEREQQAPWPRDPDGAPHYPGSAQAVAPDERARRRAAGAPFALRLDMAAAIAHAQQLSPGPLTWNETGIGPSGESGVVAAAPQAWGDVLLARKEMLSSYHLSVVVDDALQGVTQILRGQDLFWATSVHRLLQILLELPEPSYHHHRLIVDERGRKLAKSTRATALRELRAQGVIPAEIRRAVGLTGA